MLARRRSFLKTLGLTIGAVGAAPGWLRRASAQARGRRQVLVAIFQRGAADGLNLVAPFFEKRYYALRPTLAIQEPGKPNGGIDLDGRFALHPAMAPLKELWDARQLAIVHAAGSPDPSRSHFDAQEYMEAGTPGVKSDSGWLNRALVPSRENLSPMRAVAISNEVPRTLRGASDAVALNDVSSFQVGTAATSGLLEQMYAASSDARLRTPGNGAFEAARVIDGFRKQPYTPADGSLYVGQFGQRLMQIARLIKSDAGVEVAFADIGGWDHHSNEAPQLTNLSREFALSIAAFVRDLGDRIEDVMIVTMSEFGRTAAENGSGGTDHGHGNVMMMLGGRVQGGRIYGRWPGLEPEQLFEQRDLAITTDFRDVLGELVQVHLGQRPEQVFPGYTTGSPLGFLRA
jgi:uncharacterized protein (DUF1501 family)